MVTLSLTLVASTQNIARVMPRPIKLDSLSISSDNSYLTFFRNGRGYNKTNSLKNRIIRRVDLHTGKLIGHSEVKIPSIYSPYLSKSIGFISNGDRLLLLNSKQTSYLSSNTIVVYSKEGKVLQTLKEPRKDYFTDNDSRIINGNGLVLSPRGKWLALLDIDTRDTGLYIMNVSANKVVQHVPLPKKLYYGTYYGGGLSFSHNGHELSWLARGLDDGTDKGKVYLYRYSVFLKKFLKPIALKNDPTLYSAKIHYSPNGRYASFSGAYASIFHLVDLQKSTDKVVKLKGATSFIGFTTNQQGLIMLNSDNKSISIYNIKTGKEVLVPFVLKKNEILNRGEFASVVQSQDLKYLAVGISARLQQYRKDKILLFNSQNGQLIRRIEIPLEAKPVAVKPKKTPPKKVEPKAIEPRRGFFSQQVM